MTAPSNRPSSFLVCRWCNGDWQVSDPDGFARHEGHCALRVECRALDFGHTPRFDDGRPEGTLDLTGDFDG